MWKINKVKKSAGLMAALILLSLTANAQPLDTLIGQALRSNPRLQSLYTNYQATLERQGQVKLLDDPQFSASFQTLPIRTRTWEQTAFFGVMQMFPWRGTLATRNSVVVAEAQVAYERAQVEALSVANTVRLAFLDLYLLEKNKKTLAKNLELFSILERLITNRQATGTASVQDALRLQLRQREVEQRIVLLNNNQKKTLAVLNQARNVPSDAPVIVQDSLGFATLPLSKDSILALAQRTHPELQALRFEQEVSRQNQMLNRLSSRPDIGVGIDYVVMQKVIAQDGRSTNGLDMVMPKVTVRLPIYRQKYGAKQREEEYRQTAIQQEKQAVLNDFSSQIQQAFTDHESARLNLLYYQEQIKTVQAVIRLQEANISNSGNRLDDLLDNYLLLQDYQLLQLEAIVESQRAKAMLEKLIQP